MSLSKTQVKYIRSLSQQKYRNLHSAYVAEGDKLAREWLLSNEKIQYIIAESHWMEGHKELIARHAEAKAVTVKESELPLFSFLKTPNQALIVAEMPEPDDQGRQNWALALDGIQDPGNMGTLIRIADWFGISQIACSSDCADWYHPKVVQSAMGGHLRVRRYSGDFLTFLQGATDPVIAATLSGNSMYKFGRLEKGILIIGNESAGIRADVLRLATGQISIPRKGRAESLNAAVAAGIICAQILPH